MAIEMSIKLSPKQAGKLYQKTLYLEDENKKLRDALRKAIEELESWNVTEGDSEAIAAIQAGKSALAS